MTEQIRHAEYQKKLKKLAVSALLFTINDAQQAIKAMPDGVKAGYYADEIHYCNMELRNRKGGAM